MRSGWRGILAAATAVMLAAPVSWGDDATDEQLRQMEDRMRQMEERLQATNDQLAEATERADEQQKVIESAGLADGRGVSNGLTEFVETISVGGWLAGSYNYNFNGPDGSALGGANSGAVAAYPFHPDANSFSFDQLWFEVGRETSEEHRAGFYFELAYGKTAGILSGNAGADMFSGNDFDVYNAYVEYLAPVLDGVNFKFGKFSTLIGAEVAQAPYNFNISRGNVYNLFQPITHVGVLASTDIAGLSASLGLSNETRSFPAADADFQNDKAILWGLGYELGNVGLSFAGAWGQSPGPGTNAGDKEIILDWIISWDPTEDFSTYANADYINTSHAGGGPDSIGGWGIAWAGRYGITDRTGVAARFEYATLDNFFGPNQDLDSLISLTGTLDYLLTNNLMLQGELRWDKGNQGGGSNDIFIGSDSITKANQIVGLLQVIYMFDGFGE